MEFIRVAMVEDDEKDKNALTSCLTEFGLSKDHNFKIDWFKTVVSFLENFKNNYDIVFMDIELPDGDGMSAVRKLRERDKDVIVIFVTNMIQYAVKGYEVRAFDYVVKPISSYNFFVKISSAIECLNQKKDVEIWITNKNGRQLLKVSRILYVEVVGHMLEFHTQDGLVSATGTMASICKTLNDFPFSLCNRCYLVNLKYVTAVKPSTVTVGGDELQISRLKRSSFINDLNMFLAAGGGQ